MKRVLAAVLCAMVATEVIGQTMTISSSSPGPAPISRSFGTSFYVSALVIPGATTAQKAAVDVLVAETTKLALAVSTARAALAAAAYQVPASDAELRAKTEALAGAEVSLALARARAFAGIQASDDRFASDQVRGVIQFILVQPLPAPGPTWSTPPPIIGSTTPAPAPTADRRRIRTAPLTLSRP